METESSSEAEYRILHNDVSQSLHAAVSKRIDIESAPGEETVPPEEPRRTGCGTQDLPL